MDSPVLDCSLMIPKFRKLEPKRKNEGRVKIRKCKAKPLALVPSQEKLAVSS